MSPSDLDDVGPDVLLSYSRTDAVVAGRIGEALSSDGFRVWIDTDAELPGDNWVLTLERALDTMKSLVLLVSPAAMESRWVKQEYSSALARNVPLIPALVKNAAMPALVSIRQWVDFRDPAHFDMSIRELVAAIRGQRLSADGGGVESLATRLWWLWFFPEGLLWPVYRCLAGEEDGDRALTEGFVSRLQSDGAEVVRVDPQRLRILGSLVEKSDDPAVELVTRVVSCFSDEDPFSSEAAPGLGQLLLLRDVLRLYRECTDDQRDDLGADRCYELARQYLNAGFAPKRCGAAMQVSWALLDVIDRPTPIDHINHARLLMCLGQNRQAADILSVYIEGVFDISGLTTDERIAAAIDWAKAEKNAGRAGASHQQIIKSYERALELEDLSIEDRAILLNNRATQVAIFGERPDWNQIRSDLEESAKIWQELGCLDHYLRTRANFVALSLDRLGNNAQLQPLAEFLEGTDDAAMASSAGEGLFFFYYQNARVWRGMFPQNPKRAADLYRNAAQVAEAASLIHQSLIATRWVLKMERSAGLMDTQEFLQRTSKCAESLTEYSELSWAAGSLRELYLDMASAFEEVGHRDEARDAVVKAFDVEAVDARSFVGSHREARLARILGHLLVYSSTASQFIDDRWQALRGLFGGPSWKRPDWDEIAAWVESKSSSKDGNTV